MPARRCPKYRSIEQFHEVAESLSTRIVVDPDPSASIGLVGLFQSQRNVAKRTPGCRIEKICFGGFEGTGSDFHRRVFAVHSSECRHLLEGYELSVISSRISPRIAPAAGWAAALADSFFAFSRGHTGAGGGDRGDGGVIAWKRAPVYSIGWPHARARAVADLAAADFYFAIIRSRRAGPTAW